MTLNEYQELAMRTARKDQSKTDQLNNAQCGLCGEAGEFADLYKKLAWQGASFDRDRFMGEAGDCLWYLALAAVALDTSLEAIAQANIAKLKKRYPDGYDPIRSNSRAEDDI